MLKPVYAIIGDDAFLIQQKLSSLLAQTTPDAQRLEFDAERTEPADLFDELRSFAMFGGEKIVVLRNAEAFIERFRASLEGYLAAPSTSATLVLRVASLPANQRVYKLIAKLGGIEKCEPPKDLPRWIMERARTAHKLTVGLDAARLLAELIGAECARLDNELAKLALQSDNGKITTEQIATSVAFQREQKMWQMTNELAGGRPGEAIRRWRQLLQLDSSSEFRAVTWLTMWLENVRQALDMRKRGLKAPEICQALRIWQRDLQQPFMRTVDALGEAGVRRGLKLLAEIDLQNKSGIGDAPSNIERFLLSVVPR